MDQSTPEPAVSFDPVVRAVGRLSTVFILDLVKVGRGGRSFIESLLLLTIIQANLAHLQRDTEFQLAFAEYDKPPPDEARRPVSVNAVAHSLSLPYETVRRHVAKLTEQGVCVMTPRGVYVPAWVVTTPPHQAAVKGSYEIVRAFYLRLRRLGVLPDALADAAPQIIIPETPAVRAVSRASSDYFLRVVELLTAHVGNLVNGLALLSIVRGNIAHVDEACFPDVRLEPVADAERQPVRIRAIAAGLGVPEETARRHIAQLLEAGLCERTPRGLVVTGERLANAAWLQVMHANFGYLQRMFAAVGQLGVLRLWETEAGLEQG